MSEKSRSVRVVVTQTITESLETIVSVPEGASEQDIANHAVAQALDREHGWSVTENPWFVAIVEAVDAIRQGRA